uniref:T-box domain-containing protein n=1 Tax=Meloidogyne javanica TaxID=6303 RepID=A0A915N8Q7_MELJA
MGSIVQSSELAKGCRQCEMSKIPAEEQGSAFTATKEYKIELANSQLWEKFAKVQNEMVVTRPGRKMFPKLELYLHNLDPESQYTLSLYMQKVDNLRYKYQAGGWSAAGHDGENGIQQSNLVQHHEGLCKGKFWTSQGRISFERAKLTNKESLQGGNSMISLSSMSKYQPVILLGKTTPVGHVFVAEYRPPQCQFIAVTAYQSEAVTKLKVRAMANQMLGLMGISGAGVGGGIPLSSQFSPISFPLPTSTSKSWTSPQINNKRNIQDDDESAPTKAKKAKISTSTPTSQQQLLPLNDIQSPILGGNPSQLNNVNKMSTITG